MATCYYIYSLKLLEKILKVFAKYSKSTSHICNLQYLCEIITLLLSEFNFTNINFMLCYDRSVTLTIEQTLGSYHETSYTLSSLKHTPWFRHLQLHFLFKFPDSLIDFFTLHIWHLVFSHLKHFYRYKQLILSEKSYHLHSISPSSVTFTAEKSQVELGWNLWTWGEVITTESKRMPVTGSSIFRFLSKVFTKKK